ncbi:MAG: nucleotidyltransferase domain-containing protein [Oleispira sp.]
MSDGLTDQQRLSIQQVFQSFPQIEQALLYGSRAMGRYRAGSDIDLTLRGVIDLSLLNKISLSLDDLLLPYEIDLSVLLQIDNPDLRDHIQRKGIVFYQA